MSTKKQISEETTVKNSFHGWVGETITTDKSGTKWKITTIKSASGKITSTAIEIDKAEIKDGVKIIQISGLITKPRKRLIESTGRATEKTIREQHARAVLLFDEQDESIPTTKKEREEANPVRRGLKIFMWGYNKENQVKIITSVTEHGYEYVDLTSHDTGFASHLRPWSEKFGIGYYYREPCEYADENCIADAIIEANAKKGRIAEAKNKAKQERQAKIEEGLPKLKIPSYASTVIVANLVKDNSDAMSDYFAKSTEKVVYLAWSKHARNNFAEMRKAAAKFEHTKHFAEVNKDHEQRENYTGGSGYYLATHSYRGWQVEKEKYLKLDSDQMKETLAIAIVEGRFLCDDLTTEDEETQNVSVEISTNDFQILKYTERSYIIVGETKPYKDLLGRNGLKCKFNKHLKHPETGEKVMGWVFPATRLEEITKALNK